MSEQQPQGAPQSNAAIKQELRTLYGVTDFSDCLEPADLQRKLERVRETQPITHNLRYGPLLQLGNRTNPSGIVTLAHGLGDSAHGWADVGAMLAQKLPYLLFLLPTAPSRPITINGGMAMTGWYDIESLNADRVVQGRQDATAVLQSADYLRSLASVTAKALHVPPQRIVYAGFSQGAAISLVTGLTAKVAPAGVACMSGYLIAATEVLSRVVNRQIPIAMFHGSFDDVVPLEACKRSMTVLRDEVKVTTPIEYHEYGMAHSALPEEIDELTAFIRRVLPDVQSSM